METPLVRVIMAREILRKGEPVDAIGSSPLASALAETINGLYKTEVIRRRSSCKTMDEVEMETPTGRLVQ